MQSSIGRKQAHGSRETPKRRSLARRASPLLRKWSNRACLAPLTDYGACEPRFRDETCERVRDLKVARLRIPKENAGI